MAAGGGHFDRTGKKTAEAIHQEVAQEVGRIVQIVFGDWRKTGTIDLEAVEMLVRDSMHRAGAMAIQRLLCLPVPHDHLVPAVAVNKLDTTKRARNRS